MRRAAERLFSPPPSLPALSSQPALPLQVLPPVAALCARVPSGLPYSLQVRGSEVRRGQPSAAGWFTRARRVIELRRTAQAGWACGGSRARPLTRTLRPPACTAAVAAGGGVHAGSVAAGGRAASPNPATPASRTHTRTPRHGGGADRGPAPGGAVEPPCRPQDHPFLGAHLQVGHQLCKHCGCGARGAGGGGWGLCALPRCCVRACTPRLAAALPPPLATNDHVPSSPPPHPRPDFKRPPELVSYPQQVAVTATGVIWSRFSTQITPVRARATQPPTPQLTSVVAGRAPGRPGAPAAPARHLHPSPHTHACTPPPTPPHAPTRSTTTCWL